MSSKSRAEAAQDPEYNPYDHPELFEDLAEPARRPSNRVMALRLWAAIFVRGNKRCVWCDRPLNKDTATIDHYDGNHKNNAPNNLLPADRCNTIRAKAFPTQRQARKAFDDYLKTLGSSLNAAEKRARVQLATPIETGKPRFILWPPGAHAFQQSRQVINSIWAPGDRRVDKLMERWRGDRIQRIREKGAERARASRTRRDALARSAPQESLPFDEF